MIVDQAVKKKKQTMPFGFLSVKKKKTKPHLFDRQTVLSEHSCHLIL